MGLRFRKSIRIAPGIRINLSKIGVSTSIGKRGATINVGKRGVRGTVGLPGSGLSYSEMVTRRHAGDPSLGDVPSGNGRWLVIGLVVLIVAIWLFAGR